MATAYFAGCGTVGEIKTAYHSLAKLNHPDIGGDTKTMQAINAAYLKALAGLDGQVSMGSDQQEHTYRYNPDIEQAVIDKLAELFALHMKNVTIELVGTWIWVYGTSDPEQTRPYTKLLGSNAKGVKKGEKPGLGLKWHAKRHKWYFGRKSYYRRTNTAVSFAHIRYMYGSRIMEDSQEAAIV